MNEHRLQVGNAVPVRFVKRTAMKIREALEVMDGSAESGVEVGSRLGRFEDRVPRYLPNV
ncbi:MAG: hypothetical protein IT258_14870 [Saprospiraceae bacterium]|nr:hypothetical protein [Saprospiraceae bacterium]